ncbi:uncharacterized protein [Antedon mediterranea]|uniref:uncharacterized protein n=1 Tax=Antedon mediterranea TaxID=105859 RepID=UPI003AF60671
MADLNKLKLTRRNSKGQLTRTLSMIESLLKENCEPDVLKTYIIKAEEQFRKVELKHSELIDVIEDQGEFETEEKWMSECEMDFLQKLVCAKREITLRHSQSTVDVPFSTPTTPLQTSASTQPAGTVASPPAFSSPTPRPAMARSTPTMAKMKYPTFNGNIRDYKRFKELFTHCATNLTEIECFYQLTESMINSKERSMVKGCIDVARAWEVLDERYGDKDRVVDSLLKDLENLKSYESKDKINIPAMSRFVQTLQTFETRAETIGLSGELNSKIMLSQIKQKLPEEHRIAYYKSVRDNDTGHSLTGLVKWLYSQLLLLEKAMPMTETESSSSSKKASNAAVVSSAEGYKSDYNRNPKCALHPTANTHFLKSCNKFRSLSQKEKYEVMKKNRICFRCGHNNCSAGKPPYDKNSCQFAAPCGTPSCGSNLHFPAVCPVLYERKDQPNLNCNAQPFQPADPTTVVKQAGMVTHNGESKLQVTLPTVMGYLRCGKTRRPVRILLDGGSQATLLRSGLIPLTNQDVYQKHDLSLVGGKKITKKLRLLNCYIEDVNGTWSCPLTVTEIDEPCGDAPIVYKEQLKQYSHLNEIDLQVAPYPTIDVLLGVDNTHLMIWEEYLRGECINEPVAVKCPFGWFIQGGQLTTSALFNYVNVSAVGPMEDFLGIETMGLEPKKCKCSEHLTNRKATEAIDQSVKQLPNGTYEIRLPWKRAPNDLPDNYGYAVKRLKSLEKQFENRSIEWEVYCEQMRDQLKRGVSRRVTEADLKRDREAGRKMWFLPHFAVTKESKTTPVRVVYDGKARFQGHSLNDYIFI